VVTTFDLSNGALDAMFTRRSTSALAEPAPTPEQLELLLQAATTVPDHSNLRPWRFVVVPSDGRARFGDALAAAVAQANPDVTDPVLEKVRQKAFVAPMLIALVASPRPSKVAEWEQVASASCTGYAIALAAHALGLGAIWKTSPVTEGTVLAEVLGMGEADRFLGWVNVGTPTDGPREPAPRTIPDLRVLATVLTSDGPVPYDPPSTGS
jgi:nitroreductase